MAEDIEDLVVEARPEGVQETQQQMEGLQDSMEEPGGEMEETGGMMDGFANKFGGALNAAVAGLAVASAGLLSQVPVIGEAMSGLFSVVEAVAFQMDQVLRPVLGPIADGLFTISQAIFELNGPAGDLVGILGTVGSAAAIAQAALMKLGTGLGAILSGSLTAAAALGALIGTVGVGILEILGITDAIEGFGEFLNGVLPQAVTDGMVAVLSAFIGPLTVIGSAILGFVEGFLEGGIGAGIDQMVVRVKQALSIFKGAWGRTIDRIVSLIGGLIDGIVSLGGDVIGGFINGVRNMIGRIPTIMGNIAHSILSILPGFEDMKDIGENIIDGIVDGIEQNIQKVKDAAKQIAKEIDKRVGVGSDTETGPLSNFGSVPDNIVGTITEIGQQSGRVGTATNSLVQPLSDIGEGGGTVGTQEDTVINLEIDGRDIGTATEGPRRDSLADRNING